MGETQNLQHNMTINQGRVSYVNKCTLKIE
jgi:hypothetical protein